MPSQRSFAVTHRVKLAALLVVLGCLVPSTAAAQEWYELYARGEQALRNKQPQRAADLLERAIQKRPRPGMAVPTYGTNFEPRYFPYLRLAEAYIRVEAYENALKALEASARFAVEPVAERTALEGRVRSALDARRPPANPLPPPTPAPDASSSTAPPVAPPAKTAAPSEVLAPPPAVVDAPPLLPPSPRSEPVDVPPARPTPRRVPTASDPPLRKTEPVRTGTTMLEITSEPPGVDVVVDDEPRGRTDPETGRLRLPALSAGRHRVRLSLRGYDDLVREVDLAGESLAFHGVLTIHRMPSATPAAVEPSPPSTVLPRRLTLELVLGLALALGTLAFVVWFSRQTPRSMPAESAQTGSPRAVASDEDSNEGLPVEFGAYRLIRRIGKGGMASVYEAERRGERFALKRPLAGFLDDRLFLERFLRESELGRALHHPNIVRIFDRGQVGPVPYFAMELVQGETLRTRLERDGRLDVRVATAITAQIAEALDYAHHKGVIHRDLKPSNVMLERTGGVKVMDYGIARSTALEGLTVTGSFIGTPHYAAPETVDGRTEPRSDLYSLGIVFFEMLTGNLPFRGGNALEVLRQHCVTPPPVPSSMNYAVSKELDCIVLRLLSKQPSDRPTAEQLLNELADYSKRTDDDAR